jgi:hypothetical protein
MSFEISPVWCDIKPFHLQQARWQKVDITLQPNAKGGSMGEVTAEDTVLDQFICPPVLELCAAG